MKRKFNFKYRTLCFEQIRWLLNPLVLYTNYFFHKTWITQSKRIHIKRRLSTTSSMKDIVIKYTMGKEKPKWKN